MHKSITASRAGVKAASKTARMQAAHIGANTTQAGGWLYEPPNNMTA
jgi:hypothetical protein